MVLSPRQYIIVDTFQRLFDRSSRYIATYVLLSISFPEQGTPRNCTHPPRLPLAWQDIISFKVQYCNNCKINRENKIIYFEEIYRELIRR